MQNRRKLSSTTSVSSWTNKCSTDRLLLSVYGLLALLIQPWATFTAAATVALIGARAAWIGTPLRLAAASAGIICFLMQLSHAYLACSMQEQPFAKMHST